MSNLAEAEKELKIAAEMHDVATREESTARQRTCTATDRLNKAQQAVDHEIEQLKKCAPWNTNWYDKRSPLK